MSVPIIFAILSSAALLMLILRRGKATVTLVVGIAAIVSWLVVGINWVTHQWSARVNITLPDMRYVIVAAAFTGGLLVQARLLGKQAMKTVAVLLFACWLAILTGWLAGQWSGLLAVTMPSLIILFIGLVALPPFVLPVPPLPWKWPTFIAMSYTFIWLAAVWNGLVDMDIISFWVYLQGLLLILRPTFPLESVKGFYPFIILGVYGLLAIVIWRVFRAFDLTPFNLLVLTQGMLALSSYAVPVSGETRGWALAVSVLYGLGYLAAMSVGRIDISVTNFVILFLGVAAFERFLVSGQKDLDRQFGPARVGWMTAYGLFILYLLTWTSGLAFEELQPDWFGFLTFIVGAGAIIVPPFIRPSPNWQAFKAIITYNLGTNFPYYEIKGGTKVQRAAGDPFNPQLAGPGIILSDAHEAAVIYGGGAFKRVSPPGVAFTQLREIVKEVVDLRPQVRVHQIVAKTKDGIKAEVIAFTAFRIGTTGQGPQLDGSFPFDPDAIRKVVHVQRISQEDEEKVGWDVLVGQVCEPVVRDLIAEYKLDELRSLEIRNNIGSRMRVALREHIDKHDWGIELIAAGIGNIQPPDDVMQGRIQHWQAQWDSLITMLKAKAEAKERTLIENARARVQKEVVKNLTKGLEAFEDVESRDAYLLMVLSLFEAIEQEGVTDQELALQTGSRIRTLYNMLGPGEAEQTAAGGEQ